MKKIIVFAAVAALLAPLAVLADTYAKLEDIPAPLVQPMTQHNGRYEEQYISEALEPIRQSTASKNAIEAKDIEKEKKQNDLRGRGNAAERVMRYDRDFDGKVSAGEVTAAMQAERRNNDWGGDESGAAMDTQLKKQAEELVGRYDADKDGVVTLKEAAETGKAKKPRPLRRAGRLAGLLALDPDKDGSLTAAELTVLAKKAFATADADHDGILSNDEKKKIQELGLGLDRPPYGEGCLAPAPAKNDKITFLSVEMGGSLTTLGAADSGRRAVRVVRVEIAKGEAQLYIVANSRMPVIWQLTGDTARVSRFLLDGGMQNRVMASGVAGLAAGKVSYLMHDDEDGNFAPCLPDAGALRHYSVEGIIVKTDRAPAADYNAALKNILGRAADMAGLYSAPFQINIDDKVTAADAGAEQPAPEGFDEDTWKDFLLMNPGGLVKLEKKEVVSEQPFDELALQPGLAGVAQLVKSGHLKREKDPRGASMAIIYGGQQSSIVIRFRDVPTVHNDGGEGRKVRVIDDSLYRVVKDIEKYPATADGYAVRYVLGKDMEPPKDRQGCFIKDGEGDTCR